MTKIINPGDQIYVSNNDLELVASIDELMVSFIREYSEVWQRLYTRRDKKIIGTLVRFSFMAISKSRGLLVHASQWALNPRIGASDSDKIIQKTLVSHLKGSR